MRLGINGQEFVGRQAQPIFHLDDVERGQNDVNPPAALGKARHPGMALKLEPAAEPQAHR
ncbi:hypothetical protein DESC_720268 [Desulfosarcina cetonica]|nr:hypothetical protein DESC_720268 [Desulfosarcina cetonica]